MSEGISRVPLQLPGPGAARLSNDDGLARRAARGDQRAFAAIYKRHHQELFRYCRAILHDPDDAQDALQATMVKALRALPGEEREIALKPWLFRIAHNEAISIVRARRVPVPLDTDEPDPGAAVEQQAASRDRLRELVRDLDQLPERQRGSLVMRELSGLSFEEIGRVFGFGPAAAKQAVYEARVALQEIAEGREMDCELVREAISERDRRVLRGRRIRAHMRDCERCSDFSAAIGRRRTDLAALAPPIAAPAALATLQAALGGGSATGAATAAGAGAVGAGALGAGIGGGAAIKVAVAALATATIAGGAAELSDVLDRGGSTRQEASGAPAAPAPGGESDRAEDGGGASQGGSAGSRPAGPGGSGGGRAADGGRGNGGREHGGQGTAPGQTGTAPGQSAAPGQTGTAPGQGGGNSASAPGQTGAAPGQSGSQGASANGQADSSTGASRGGNATAPGQTDGAPGQDGTAGNSADAPRHDN